MHISPSILSNSFFYSGFGEGALGEGDESFSVKTEEIAHSFGKITGNASGHGTVAETLDTSMAEGK